MHSLKLFAQSRGLARAVHLRPSLLWPGASWRGFAITKVQSQDEFEKIVKGNPNKLLVGSPYGSVPATSDHLNPLLYSQVINWSAEWCGPCKAMAPTIEKYSEQYKDVVFVKVDIDKLPETAEARDITAVPAFDFVVNEERVSHFAPLTRHSKLFTD